MPRPNTYATWQDGESADEVALTVPARPGRYPLVIYLLALGEGRTAGEAWRSAWAWAGYMVLALQQLARRQAANEAPLERADLSRVALAGFDLGAFTAMAVAGEGLRNVAALPRRYRSGRGFRSAPMPAFPGPLSSAAIAPFGCRSFP